MLIIERHFGDDVRLYEDVSPTLKKNMGDGGGNVPMIISPTFSQQRSDEYKASETASTASARDYKCAKDLALRGGCNVESAVRRLTPLETERLQGMPDNWSKYGVNDKGEVYELSDAARYRLQGNGIAVPWWRWLLKRISAQYEQTPTLGSLFDGQASFPMIWEGINGKGTAVWSSEIEKDAIAVARYHFPDEETDDVYHD